jgi:NitT/TauT family transport system substrate-binding protein
MKSRLTVIPPSNAGKEMKRPGRTVTIVLLTALFAPSAFAEGGIRIAEQFGIGYLPLQVMRHERLLEEAGRRQGVDIAPSWTRLGSGSSVNDAILAGEIDIGAGGVGPLLLIWDRTKGEENVHGIAALDSMPLYLTTRNPAVKSLEDFSPADRIALPSVGTSVQARTLQMAAAKTLGSYVALDGITVALPHPEATAAMLSGSAEINAHFGSPPFQYTELDDPNISRVLSSYDVLGGPTTFNLVWTTEKFRSDNPKTYRAFVEALGEAVAFINADKEGAAEIYAEYNEGGDAVAEVLDILNDPEIVFTLEPENTLAYAGFMHDVGALENRPADWKDYFFPEARTGDGS